MTRRWRFSSRAYGKVRAAALPPRASPCRSRGAPRQTHGRSRHRHQPFTAAGETHFFAGRRLDPDAPDGNAGDVGDTRADGVAVRRDSRAFAYDRDVEMRDDA